MERFVFVAAIIVAVIYGIVAMVSSHIGVDFDGPGAAPVVQVSPGTMAVQSFAGGSIEIKHAAAIVTITPEDRQDFSVQIDNPGHAPMPTVSTEGNNIVIEGNLRGRIGRCHDDSIELRGYDTVSKADLPHITIHAPRALSADLSGAVYATIGATQSFDGDFAGCGDSTVADVTEQLKLDMAGSGSVHTGAAHALNADLAGSGEIVTGAIAEGASLDVAGSGSITIGSLAGTLSSNGAGSGDVHIQGGSVTNADIDLAGSGGVSIAAPVQTLKVSIIGSGDVDVAGAVGSINADIAGSGSVSAASVSGNVEKHTMGSGTVRIGH